VKWFLEIGHGFLPGPKSRFQFWFRAKYPSRLLFKFAFIIDIFDHIINKELAQSHLKIRQILNFLSMDIKLTL
jgi:hypothetical protein